MLVIILVLVKLPCSSIFTCIFPDQNSESDMILLKKNCKWAASLGKDGMRSSWLKACLSLGPSDPVVGLMPWAGFEGWYTLLLYNLYNNDKCYRPICVLTPVQNNIFCVFLIWVPKNQGLTSVFSQQRQLANGPKCSTSQPTPGASFTWAK